MPESPSLSELFQDQELIKTAPESKYRKAAKLLILAGPEEAARILSRFDENQVAAISREIAAIKGVTKEEATELFTEFSEALAGGVSTRSFIGGLGEARRILYAAFGPEKGEALLVKAVPAAREKPFGFLEEYTAEQLGILFKEESPAATALVLSRLPPQLAADVINNADPIRKTEIVKRIAKMDKIAPSVMERIADALKEKIRKIGKTDSESIDGMNALTAILKSADLGFETRLLEELENKDPALSYDLRARLYTLDDILRMDDRVLEEKLRSMSEKEIVFLLKGRNSAFIEKIMSNVSAPRRALIREESGILGPVARIETDMVAGDFLNWFRRGRETGAILLSDDDDILI